MWIYLLLLAALIIAAGIMFEKWLRKKLNIPKREGMIYKGVHPAQKWVEFLILGGYFVLILMIDNPPPYLFLLALGVLMAFRTFMEWKFARGCREYIITSISVATIGLGAAVVFFYSV